MTTYAKPIRSVSSALFDGSADSVVAVQAICPEARLDPTMEQFMWIPTGARASTQRLYVGDTLLSAATGQFTILRPSTASALLTTTDPVKKATMAGGAAGDITVSGVAVGDVLVAVYSAADNGSSAPTIASLLSEFSVTATNTINNTGGTSTSGKSLIVVWVTPA
jgi:hypothetical protein